MLFGPFKQEFAGGPLAHRNSKDIAIKSYAPALRPVWCLVIVYTQSGTHRAEECMPYRIDHNADVSAPDDEIAGLRIVYSLKVLSSVVQIRGSCIRIGKSRMPVDPCARDGSSPA